MTLEAGCTGTFYARRCDDWFEAVIPQGKWVKCRRTTMEDIKRERADACITV